MPAGFGYAAAMARLHFVLGVSVSSLALAGAVACSSEGSTGDTSSSSSSSSSSSGGVTDGGGAKDSASDAPTDAGASVNACNTFKDETAASSARAILWDFAVATAPERCMRVKKGQSVTWNGNFTSHPLDAQGGATPNPITSSAAVANSVTIAFPNAGTYGFVCTSHPAMTGAIDVVE